MPRGALIELTAKGQHDLYLTGTPSITFWKTVYRRHTSFSMESIEQVFDNAIDFGSKTSCTLKRSGDLVNKIYFVCKLPVLETTDFFQVTHRILILKQMLQTQIISLTLHLIIGFGVK